MNGRAPVGGDSVVRAEEPVREHGAQWRQGVAFVWSMVLFFFLAGWRWLLVVVGAVAVVRLGVSLWRRQRAASPPGFVEVQRGGLARSGHPGLPLVWGDLTRIDGQEHWPNLRLHRVEGKAIDLFPWSAAHDDVAAIHVAEAVLARATAAGIDTSRQPMATWRPTRHRTDWDRAIVAPSRWSRRS